MTLIMITDRAAVGVYLTHKDAEVAVRMLEKAGVSLQQISIIGRDRNEADALVGHYSPPEFVEHGLQHQGERAGAWMGGLLGLLVGCSSFFLPGIGALVALGPLAGVLGGVGAGAAIGYVTGDLTFTDISSDLREWLVAGDYVVVVHCSTAEEPRVQQIMEGTRALIVKSHP